jgi:hypothetical protein
MPLDLRVKKDGVAITFTDPLDSTAADPDNFGVEWFNIKRTRNYGSKEYSISDPEKVGREPVEVTAAKVADDGRTVTLTIPDMRPVTNMVIQYRFKAADGTVIENSVANTINEVPK